MNEKILIIDREPDIRKTLETLLRKEGYQVRSASGGKEAIDILKSEPLDLVIMDINLPGTNGLNVMGKIKKLEKDIKVIVLTGLASFDHAVQTLRHEGAFDFLCKPLKNKDQLIVSIERALEKSRLDREKNLFARAIGNHRPAKKRILIVDDDSQTQELLTTILSEHQYETEVASDGFEAGRKVMEFKPDLIILDLIMPGMDGFEVCRRLKRDSSTSQIKILAITGYDTPENSDRIMEAGADDYLAKPLQTDKVLQHIETLLTDNEFT